MYYNVFEGSNMHVNVFKGVVKVLCCFIRCLNVFENGYVCLNIVLQVFPVEHPRASMRRCVVEGSVASQSHNLGH